MKVTSYSDRNLTRRVFFKKDGTLLVRLSSSNIDIVFTKEEIDDLVFSINSAVDILVGSAAMANRMTLSIISTVSTMANQFKDLDLESIFYSLDNLDSDFSVVSSFLNALNSNINSMNEFLSSQKIIDPNSTVLYSSFSDVVQHKFIDSDLSWNALPDDFKSPSKEELENIENSSIRIINASPLSESTPPDYFLCKRLDFYICKDDFSFSTFGKESDSIINMLIDRNRSSSFLMAKSHWEIFFMASRAVSKFLGIMRDFGFSEDFKELSVFFPYTFKVSTHVNKFESAFYSPGYLYQYLNSKLAG